MINNNRIVPILRTDYLTLIGTILKIANVSATVINAKDVEGTFEVTGSGNAGTKLADQPVKSLDFKSGVTAGVVYFVADFAYDGFKVAGTAVETAGATVKKDAATLYTATLSSGTVTIAAISPVAD